MSQLNLPSEPLDEAQFLEVSLLPAEDGYTTFVRLSICEGARRTRMGFRTLVIACVLLGKRHVYFYAPVYFSSLALAVCYTVIVCTQESKLFLANIRLLGD